MGLAIISEAYLEISNGEREEAGDRFWHAPGSCYGSRSLHCLEIASEFVHRW